MVNFVRPQYTKSKINASGKRTIKATDTEEDRAVIENFRGSHAYVLNTFQANIRAHSRGIALSVGQRLKRRRTMLDKLVREPTMPLSAMHDIAGCRIVFSNIEELLEVRKSMHASRWRHALTHDVDRYNYIEMPKSSGYRGIHDVYQYNVNSIGGVDWNGLRVEIQYRTLPQHAWATAVEVADLFSSSKIKFSDAAEQQLAYFRLASEVIARTSEGLGSCCSELSDRSLAQEFEVAENSLGLLAKLDGLRRASIQEFPFKRNTLLIFRFDLPEGEEPLLVKSFKNVNLAIKAYADSEIEYGDRADIVLVRGDDEENIRDAFRNYFSDARGFVDLVRTGLNSLT